jgi:hypothetical protein
MPKFFMLSLLALLACLTPDSAHAQAQNKGADSGTNLVCAQLYAYYAPASAEAKAMRDLIASNRGNDGGLDIEIAGGVDSLKAKAAADPSAANLYRSSAEVECPKYTHMAAPAIAATVILPPEDGSPLRCGSVLHAFELMTESEFSDTTMALTRMDADSRKQTVRLSEQIIRANGVEMHKRKPDIRKLIAELLVCSDRYALILPKAVLLGAPYFGVPTSQPSVIRFCDDRIRAFNRQRSTISTIRANLMRNPSDMRELIAKEFASFNAFRLTLVSVGCPAANIAEVDLHRSAFVAAVRELRPEYGALVSGN